MDSHGSLLGNAVRRVEDPDILFGRAEYVDDLEIPGGLHLVFVRSTVAHAELRGIDTAGAAGMPGVAGVFTAADLDVPTSPGLMVLSVIAALLVSTGATIGGSLVYDYGFNVETAGDHPVWHKNEVDVLPGQK